MAKKPISKLTKTLGAKSRRRRDDLVEQQAARGSTAPPRNDLGPRLELVWQSPNALTNAACASPAGPRAIWSAASRMHLANRTTRSSPTSLIGINAAAA